MFSLSVNTLNLKLSTTFLSPTPPLLCPKPTSISASLIPANPAPASRNLYQPFRPPPSPLPEKFRSLDTAGRIEILSNRLGLWFEYAPLIPALVQDGFTPPSIEEATGISGVEQNRLVVAARVRDSLIESNTDPAVVSSFDTGGAELLYEIRLLSAAQRAAAAKFLVENRYDAKMAQDLARSMKDYPRRRGEKNWERFDYNRPGDCLAFMYYRQALENKNPSEQRSTALDLAMEAAQSESGKLVITEELEGKTSSGEGDKEIETAVKVPVVRLKIGEVSEARTVVVLPVCRAEALDKEVLEAPSAKSSGEFGIVVSDKAWDRWVALPGWEPMVALGDDGVVVSFPDAKALPWKVKRWYKDEPILVVADRGRKEVALDDGFYLVAAGGGLKVERGAALKEAGVEESLGTVVIVVRPPKDEVGEEMGEEDWE